MNRPSSSTPEPTPPRYSTLRRFAGPVAAFLLRLGYRVAMQEGVQQLIEALWG